MSCQCSNSPSCLILYFQNLIGLRWDPNVSYFTVILLVYICLKSFNLYVPPQHLSLSPFPIFLPPSLPLTTSLSLPLPYPAIICWRNWIRLSLSLDFIAFPWYFFVPTISCELVVSSKWLYQIQIWQNFFIVALELHNVWRSFLYWC